MAITYTDKVQNAVNPLPVTEQWRAVDANEVKTEVNTHLSSTSNPHSVTKSQVGLANADNTSDANKPVSTAQQTALDLKENLYVDIDIKTDMDYTLALTDKDTKGIFMDSTSPHTLTLPLNSDVPIPIGARIPITKFNTGTVTIVPFAGGVVVANSSSNSLVIENRYSSALAIKTDTNEWLILNGSPSLTWTTFTATITGYQSGLSYDITYIIEGKKLTMRGAFSGLGNTAAVAITNMPAVCRYVTITPIIVVNNVTQQLGRCDIAVGGTTLTFYSSAAGAAFTNNVTRTVYFTVTYEIQ